MTVIALGLVACGDDNDDNSASEGTNAQTAATTGTTTQTKTTEEKKSKSSSTKKKSASGSSSDDSSSSKQKSSSGSSGSSNAGDPITAEPDPDRNDNAGKSKQLYTQKEAENLSSQLIAKRVCQGFLPKQTERDLEKGRTTKQKVAAQYAKGWPESKQAVARRGCLQGLNARDK
jgi:hypothetical protein